MLSFKCCPPKLVSHVRQKLRLKSEQIPQRKKGFTLVELLIVVMIIVVLAIAGITTYVNSSSQLRFLASFKNVMSAMRAARSNAINNREVTIQVNGAAVKQLPNAYGLAIDENSNFYLFADSDATNFVFDQSSDQILQTYQLSQGDFRLEAQDSAGTVLGNSNGLPIAFFYKTGSGDLTVVQNSQIVSKIEHKFVALRHYKTTDNALVRYLVVFQVSGLPEEFVSVTSITNQ